MLSEDQGKSSIKETDQRRSCDRIAAIKSPLQELDRNDRQGSTRWEESSVCEDASEEAEEMAPRKERRKIKHTKVLELHSKEGDPQGSCI